MPGSPATPVPPATGGHLAIRGEAGHIATRSRHLGLLTKGSLRPRLERSPTERIVAVPAAAQADHSSLFRKWQSECVDQQAGATDEGHDVMTEGIVEVRRKALREEVADKDHRHDRDERSGQGVKLAREGARAELVVRKPAEILAARRTVPRGPLGAVTGSGDFGLHRNAFHAGPGKRVMVSRTFGWTTSEKPVIFHWQACGLPDGSGGVQWLHASARPASGRQGATTDVADILAWASRGTTVALAHPVMTEG